MNELKRNLSILNLTGELSLELADYFAHHKIPLYDPMVTDSSQEFTHILCSGDVDYEMLAKTYDTTLKNIKIISLTNAKDVQSFVWANGKLVFDEAWLRTPVGEFILDKFFMEFGGIEIRDNYPKFQELGKFNILNPFNSGEYTDVMVYDAIQAEFNGLQIKTYFDHLLMYLMTLKNKNKAGIPFEVSYGNKDGVFALQVHFVITDIVMSDISSCLSDIYSDKSLGNILTVALNSTAFFDFTHLNQVNKAVLTAFWLSGDHRIKHRGVMFNDVLEAGDFLSLPVESEGKSWLEKEAVIEDVSFKMDQIVETEKSHTIHESGLDKELAVKISGDIGLEAVKQIVSGTMAEKEVAQVIKGIKEELSAPIVVKGSKDEDDIKIKISSKDKYQELISIVKGQLEEEKSVFHIKGDKTLDIDKFVVKVSSSLNQTVKGDTHLKLKVLNQKLPERIKSSFFDFSKKLNKEPHELTENEIDEFQEFVIPEVMSEVLQYEEHPTLKLLDSSDPVEVKSFFKDVLGQSQSIKEEPFFNKPAIVESRKDEAKIQQLENDLKKLQKQLEFSQKETKSFKDAQLHSQAIKKQAQLIAENSVHSIPHNTDEDQVRDALIKQIEDSQKLSKEDSLKLVQLHDKEKKLVAELRSQEFEFKKNQIEATQKEALYIQELEKTQRALRAKDLVLDKAKDSIAQLVTRKDEEINDLKHRLDQMSKSVVSQQALGNVNQLRDLEKKNSNLEKMLEVYKNKIQSISANMTRQTGKETDARVVEENRKLNMLKNQLSNQLEAAKKDLKRFADKAEEDQGSAVQLKRENAKLQQEIKELNLTVSKGLAPQIAPSAERKVDFVVYNELQNQYDTMVKDFELRLKDTEAKLSEALKAVMARPTPLAPAEDSKGKTAQLEQSLKSVSKELGVQKTAFNDSKKDVQKLRNEKTALQNQVDRLNKELEKLKGSAKKPGNAA